jgi:excinuclease UvrABC nuclease subunit
MNEEMQQASTELRFEDAARLRDEIDQTRFDPDE